MTLTNCHSGSQSSFFLVNNLENEATRAMFSSPTSTCQPIPHYSQQSPGAMILSTPPSQLPQRKRKLTDSLPSTVLFAPSTFNRKILNPKPRVTQTKFGSVMSILPQDQNFSLSPAMIRKLTSQTTAQSKKLRREESGASAMSTDEDFDQEDKMSVSSSPVAQPRSLPMSISAQLEEPPQQIQRMTANSNPNTRCHVCKRSTENRGSKGKLVVGLPVERECTICQKTTCSVCTRQCISCERKMCGNCTVDKHGWEVCPDCVERLRRRD